MTRLAMLFDASKCIGCKGCQVACKQWWGLPGSETEQTGSYENPADLGPNTWTRVTFHEYEEAGRTQWLFLAWGCVHCTQAACVDVCPTAALKHNELGLVSFERDLCNGCGYCTQACPFGVPRLEMANPLTGQAKASKCTFCQDRATNGLIPACVKTCPPGALEWGERDALIAKAKARVEWLKARGYAQAQLYGEKELGGLGRLFVLTAPPEAYGLPANPQYPTLAAGWQRGVQPFGYVAVGATVLGLAINWIATRRARLNNVEVIAPESEGEKEG